LKSAVMSIMLCVKLQAEKWLDLSGVVIHNDGFAQLVSRLRKRECEE